MHNDTNYAKEFANILLYPVHLVLGGLQLCAFALVIFIVAGLIAFWNLSKTIATFVPASFINSSLVHWLGDGMVSNMDVISFLVACVLSVLIVVLIIILIIVILALDEHRVAS